MPQVTNEDKAVSEKGQDVDLEQMMEDDTDDTTKPADSSSSSSSSMSCSSEEQTSLDKTAFICSTATCGEIYDSAAALRAHERKHSGRHLSDERIHCDYPRCQKHYGTKRALQ